MHTNKISELLDVDTILLFGSDSEVSNMIKEYYDLSIDDYFSREQIVDKIDSIESANQFK